MTAPADDCVDLHAIAAIGVGGYIIRTPGEVFRILQIVSVSGRIFNIALGDGLAAHISDKCNELELAAMESGEVLRDLGLYQKG